LTLDQAAVSFKAILIADISVLESYRDKDSAYWFDFGSAGRPGNAGDPDTIIGFSDTAHSVCHCLGNFLGNRAVFFDQSQGNAQDIVFCLVAVNYCPELKILRAAW